jgi:hypothetical protein
MKVCQISCRMNIDDTRQTRVRDAIIASGAEVTSIMTAPRGVTHQWERGRFSCVILPRTPDIFYKATFSHLVPALWSRFRNFVKAFTAAVRSRPDVVHCVEPDSWVIAMFIKCFFGASYIIDFEETYEDTGHRLPRFLGITLKRFLQILERIAFHYAEAVIYPSEYRKKMYAAIPAKRTFVVSNFANPKHFEVEADSRPAELRDKFIVLHAGALKADYAGHELLLAIRLASKSVPGLVCVVLGGMAHQDPAYTDLLMELTEHGTLFLKPQLSFAQVIQYMKMSDVGLSLVLPLNLGLQLACPRKLFEYMAAGLPVIASDAPDIRDAVERSKCGLLVDARKPEEISDAIIKLAENFALRKTMAKNSARMARAAYDWRTQAEKLTTFYRQLGHREFTAC